MKPFARLKICFFRETGTSANKLVTPVNVCNVKVAAC